MMTSSELYDEAGGLGDDTKMKFFKFRNGRCSQYFWLRARWWSSGEFAEHETAMNIITVSTFFLLLWYYYEVALGVVLVALTICTFRRELVSRPSCHKPGRTAIKIEVLNAL